MSGSRKQKSAARDEKRKKSGLRWVLYITGVTFFTSVVFSFASGYLGSLGHIWAYIVLFLFISIGITFDIIGLAVATAEERPFHSMASHKVKGAQQGIWLVRHAAKMSSICNDVVGDITGIITGATAAVVAAGFSEDFNIGIFVSKILFSAVVAALTVGGKAAGKLFAMKNNTKIVHITAVLLYKLKIMK